jgi:glycosyltransferase involved in cell wall biosynthesis
VLHEAANVARAIPEARRTAVWSADRHQIVVVDDGSTDRTAEIAAEVARRLSCQRHPPRPQSRAAIGKRDDEQHPTPILSERRAAI